MKQTALVKFILFAIVLSIGAVGCTRNPKSLTPIPGQGGNAGGNGPNDANMVVDDPLDGEQLDGRVGVADGTLDAEHFAANTVYFAFDSSEVGPDQLANIEEVAAYLKQNARYSVIVEGHCDERGTPEYNRALGERRAKAIQEILTMEYGLDMDAVYPNSMGEDVPAVDGANEEAYALNRRGEFILIVPNN